jgi:hypothetical protein
LYCNEAHWTGFGVSLSKLNGLNGINQGTSTYIHLNLLDYVVPVNKNFLFAIGLGFDWQSYKFKGNVSLRNDNDDVTRFIFDNDINYKSSRFRIYHLVISFIFEYQTGHGKFDDFFVQAGVEMLIKTSSSSKIEYRNDRRSVTEVFTGLNTNTLNARFILRTGLDDFSFIASYQPFSIFKKDFGPDLKPYSIGLMLNF